MMHRRGRAVRARICVLAASVLMPLDALAAGPEATAPHPVPAITSPFFNESPYITTEIRPIYMFNLIPDDFTVTDGGYANIGAVQLRYAVNERLGLIVTKNGYANLHFSELLPDADGALNVAFGVKYALIAKPERANFFTVGARYEAPAGDLASAQLEFQGGGAGMFDMFATYGTHVGWRTGFQTSAGFDVALDGDHDSTLFHYAFHLDHEVFPNWYGVFEGNIVTTVASGTRTDSGALGSSFEGMDLFNFGSTNSGTVATMAGGARYRFNRYLMFGAAGEFPVSHREDITQFRLTFDTIVQF